MALQHLNKLILGILILSFSSKSWSSDYVCKETKVNKKDKLLCFMREESFFITPDCQKNDCKFIQAIKKIKPQLLNVERPGTTLCRAVAGKMDSWKLSSFNYDISVCQLDKTTISLNLLESWNGTLFTGPAESMSFKNKP